MSKHTVTTRYEFGCRLVSEPGASWRVEYRGKVLGWVDYLPGDGWFPYCHEDGCCCFGGPMKKAQAVAELIREARPVVMSEVT